MTFKRKMKKKLCRIQSKCNGNKLEKCIVAFLIDVTIYIYINIHQTLHKEK